ncbi:transglutaminase-like domain-containing protein [Pelagicoccus albus]|uniref:Transglutaminase-like domain-containing protein n=1 Tax=Pelagicoccus albus TaxID=415222 RepID=A0A7X1B934_9BACT|nr:transglutaminase domain-containing protein [Pelagicoccus albus]MBC2606630.1 hypothetical protein [Pelagicoccus albus]
MKNEKPLFSLARVGVSYWLALSSALVAFSIVSGATALPLLITGIALLLQSLSPQASPRRHAWFSGLFIFVAYLFALYPLWPYPYFNYYGLPATLLFLVALIAALNRQSFGGSRGVTSIAAISFLLFIRNVAIFFVFEAPIAELSYSIGFVCFMEIATSTRFGKSKDNPHPELAFGLTLALIASFQIESMTLGVFLAGLPIAAFLIRNHILSEVSNEYTRPAIPIHATRPPQRFHPSLFILPLALAALLYLVMLRLPFWADSIPRHAPPLAKNLAEKANELSQAADLPNDSIESLANDLINEEFFREKAAQLADTWETLRDAKSSPEQVTRSERQAYDDYKPSNSTRPAPNNSYSNRELKNTDEPNTITQSRAIPNTSRQKPNPPPQDPIVFENKPQKAPTGPSTPVSVPNPPTVSLGSGTPEALRPDSSETFGSNESGEETGFGLGDQAPSLAQRASEYEQGVDFEHFLENFDHPGRAIAESLNLEGSDVSALLSQEPLITVKLDSAKTAPDRIYLRSNVLDTVSKNGFGGSRSEESRVEVETENAKPLPLEIFRASRSPGSTVTITANLQNQPTLPLVESFSAIQIFDTKQIAFYPQDRVVVAPLSEQPIAYRLYQADMDITERENLARNQDASYLQRMLEIPLDRSDRNFLKKLASRVGGLKSPTSQFANRFANYFEKRHPYSYFVSIPPGKGHAVVRWLKNESPGLCSNYAAAFTLLARSRGIPTRVVGGFASNEYDSKDQRFLLRQRNAHAWVEYLDESNRWIRFDPTPRISPAEMQRAQSYVSQESPHAFENLVEAEQKALAQTEDTKTQLAKDSLDPEPTKMESITGAQDELIPEDTSSAQTADTSPVARNVEVPKNEASDTQNPTGQSGPQPTADSSRSSEPAPSVSPPLAVANPEPESVTPSPRIAAQESEDLETAPPWLLILLLLTIVVPGAFLVLKTSRQRVAPPEMRIRQKAGKLLAKLDSLLSEHQLADDPIWRDTRRDLSQQRYGRESNAALVQDLGVRVALLEKRKKA